MIKIFLSLISFLTVVISGPLDDYVNYDDGYYSWFDTGVTLSGIGPDISENASWVGYVLNVTSQKWMTDSDTSHSIWWHYLVVIIPNEVDTSRTNWGLLYVTGGDNTDGYPSAKSEDLRVSSQIAMANKMVVGSLFQIPNQPIVFSDDPTQARRTEDALVAHTWDHYLRNISAPEYIALFPMTKGAVKAMDCMTEFANQRYGYNLENFGVSGASKRGWTTWLTAAVDSRVKIFAPIVFDALNMKKNFHRWFTAYNGWTFAFEDYYNANITARVDTPEFVNFTNLVDPYSYIDRYAGRPKLIVDATNDEFFFPDDEILWYDDMSEPKYILMSPNTEHSFATGVFEAVPAISTFMDYYISGSNYPKFDWTIDEETGNITVVIDKEFTPSKVTLWYGNTCSQSKRRDFRIANLDYPCNCGIFAEGYCANVRVLFKPENIPINSDNIYVGSRPLPAEGQWTAFLIDIQFESNKIGWPVDGYGTLEFTTQVSVIPKNEYPYPDCVGTECYGVLV